ncbi:DNA repair protein RecN [Hydrogenovibrio marinus]|uniref:DNA repair protein RecN n=1 Tax=Hydrogenovibrio marinus TaxID=28885 RepID=A0A066ZZV2_HYDMR|nr:DNA repair protein RecN [Hydrogenovibrio marinus]KDN95625.1 DNA recombination protein RecN [Hydrogenovibrio marinus]BBN60122.1 DNA repair protein RecN [Hydrogenovibrio marinus]
MLQTLTIQNLALIEKLSLDFHSGFTTLTGETGAGKSILLDALGLALGERADSGLVRHGTPRADITADFEVQGLPQVQAWLADNEFDDEGNCLLRRTLTSEGRSKAYINGLPASISQLKGLSDLLIDIHGQHEHQSLLHSNKQLELLDAYANHPKLLEGTQQTYQQWQSLKKRYKTLHEQQSDRQSQLDLLNFQLKEFDKVMPVADEYDALAEEQNGLAHASEIKQAVYNAYELIEGEEGVTEKLSSAIHALESVAEYSPTLEKITEQLNSLLIDAQEAANDIQAQDHHIDLDPARLQAVDERLSELFGLAKRYTLEPQELVDKHQQIREALAELEDSDASLESLKAEIEQAEAAYQKAADALTKSRGTSGKQLGDTVTDAMKTLGMENGQFKIEITPSDKPSATGSDTVNFLVTANKGQPLQPLAKVASGGELSRISLAIQVASAEVASLPTLIFDEVDVGIGGGIAEVVGQKMQQLGKHRQILSITHLAQVAAYGNQHLNIAKSTDGEQTTTQVTELGEAERIEELARMLGGMTITENTRNHAKEMLATAQKK